MATDKETDLARLKQEVRRYYDTHLAGRAFTPGQSPVPVTGKTYDHEELQMLVEASLDCWWTEGRHTQEAAKRLAAFLGVRSVMLCNSGSSANLLALTALTSPLIGEGRITPGSEIIAVAAGFPTTVNPILQIGCTPVFLDIALPTYNIDTALLEHAITPKTRAIMIAHTLGNPWDIDAVMTVARKHKLWVIEDCCDALGSTYKGKHVGTFGDVATLSFYPAHHITCGEGGAVFTDNPRIKRAVESFRDWGRDCWCMPGKDNTCGKRFLWQLGKLPLGYDHKYIYSHIGYNLKTTDLQGALLLAQLPKLPGFVAARKENFARLRATLAPYARWLILPEATPGSDPSWFGFLITVRADAGFTRDAIVAHLEGRRIATRMLFAGNITKQPSFQGVEYRVVGSLSVTDQVMERTFWIGVWPGIMDAMHAYIAQAFADFFADRV